MNSTPARLQADTTKAERWGLGLGAVALVAGSAVVGSMVDRAVVPPMDLSHIVNEVSTTTPKEWMENPTIRVGDDILTLPAQLAPIAPVAGNSPNGATK